MSRTVIDASVAIKWVVEENGTPEALALLNEGSLLAPDLLIPECVLPHGKILPGGLDAS